MPIICTILFCCLFAFIGSAKTSVGHAGKFRGVYLFKNKEKAKKSIYAFSLNSNNDVLKKNIYTAKSIDPVCLSIINNIIVISWNVFHDFGKIRYPGFYPSFFYGSDSKRGPPVCS